MARTMAKPSKTPPPRRRADALDTSVLMPLMIDELVDDPEQKGVVISDVDLADADPALELEAVDIEASVLSRLQSHGRPLRARLDGVDLVGCDFANTELTESWWYDVVALMTRRFDPKSHGGLSGKVRNGRDDISEEFTHQLRGISAVSRASMGNLPILIGEFGIPYEMNLGEAYASGDWSKHELLLDCNYRALEASLLHSTQWNYTPDNSHAHGDQWNDEDLSIFSPDDQADPADLDSGGRATRAFCRPYLRFCAGRPVRMAFDLERGVFEAAIEADPDVAAATIVFAPRLHYPGAPKITVSAGRARHDPVSQTIVWEHADARGELSITLEPA